MKHISKKSLILVILFGLAFTLVGISSVAASGVQVTVGELNTFAAGPAAIMTFLVGFRWYVQPMVKP